jgi:hypothetical protein
MRLHPSTRSTRLHATDDARFTDAAEKAKDNSTKTFKTAEFALAVSLLYCDFPLIGVEQMSSGSERMLFVFADTDHLQESVEKYWDDALICSPKRWHGLSRELKSRMRMQHMRAGP